VELGIAKATVYAWKNRIASGEESTKRESDESGLDQEEVKDTPGDEAVEPEAKNEQGIPPRHVSRRYSPSQKGEILTYAVAHDVSKAADRFGCSRASIYEWRRKKARAEEGDGDDPTVGENPNDHIAERDRAILEEWHTHPGLGPSQISNQLRRRGIKVATNTVRRVMEDHGYKLPKVKRHEHQRRYEAVRPNHLWHLDFYHHYINSAKTFTLIILDDHSRFVVGHDVDDAERADLVIKAFETAVERYGRPEMLMHDRGSAFWSWSGISRFTRLLEELGIDQIVAREKENNGKVEVFNKNIAKELFDKQRFSTLAEMRRALSSHLHWYNHQRTSHALGGLLVPADRYYGRVAEVMARIENEDGVAVDFHLPNLGTRELEFFRVVQRNGVPEVWLLGRKILSLDG
jgi:transposase InsO family protein